MQYWELQACGIARMSASLWPNKFQIGFAWHDRIFRLMAWTCGRWHRLCRNARCFGCLLTHMFRARSILPQADAIEFKQEPGITNRSDFIWIVNVILILFGQCHLNDCHRTGLMFMQLARSFTLLTRIRSHSNRILNGKFYRAHRSLICINKNLHGNKFETNYRALALTRTHATPNTTI